MAKGRLGFIIYHDLMDQTAFMTDEQRGQLFRALMAYSSRGEVYDGYDREVMCAFYFCKPSIDANIEKYEQVCETNRRNVLKRWNKQSMDIPPYSDEYESY